MNYLKVSEYSETFFNAYYKVADKILSRTNIAGTLMNSSIIIKELPCHSGFKIGYIQLNAIKTLNALSLEMINAIYPKLLHWQDDHSIVAIFIEGAGDNAFCAGGDVVSLYHDLITNAEDNKQYTALTEKYFTQEYQLDFLIHQYQKPIIVWGNGIVLGGGVGLMVGASHRIVTERTKLAMPEVSIGLFPDVSGSHFLNAIPNNLGLFVGLTGAMLNAEDSIYSGLADYKVESSNKKNLLEKLLTLQWSKQANINHEEVNQLLESISEDVSLENSNLKFFESDIIQALTADTLAQIVENILSFTTEEQWFINAQQSLKKGSPLAIHLIYHQLAKSKALSIADCFKNELNLILHCCSMGDFKEGVRALLVEKDRNPQWQCKKLKDVENNVVGAFFEPIWNERSHPLNHLTL